MVLIKLDPSLSHTSHFSHTPSCTASPPLLLYLSALSVSHFSIDYL